MRTRWGFRITDFYVLSEIIGPFFGGVFFFLFIFLMFQILRLAEFFIVHGVSFLLLSKLTSLLLLSFLPFALPIAFLLSILIAFGRLSIDSELVALKASGISVLRLSAPVFIFALIISLLSLGLNLEWVPRGEQLFKSTLIKVSETKTVSSLRAGAFTSGFFDLLIFTDHFDTATNHLKNVFIYDEREPKTPVTVVAKEGEIILLKPATELGAAAILKLYSGNIHRSDLEERTYQKIDFNEYQLYLEVNEGSGFATRKTKMIPYTELKHLVHNTPKDTRVYREYLTELWRRYMVGVTPFFFVFLGIGYGTIRTRAVKTGAVLISLGVVLVYWLTLTVGTMAASDYSFNPIVAMLIPNFILLAFGIPGFKAALW